MTKQDSSSASFPLSVNTSRFFSPSSTLFFRISNIRFFASSPSLSSFFPTFLSARCYQLPLLLFFFVFFFLILLFFPFCCFFCFFLSSFLSLLPLLLHSFLINLIIFGAFFFFGISSD